MGSKSSSQTQNQSQSGSSSTTLAPRSGSEQQILNQLQGLGDNQLSFLTSLMNGGTSPFALNAQDQAALDASYKGAIDQYNNQGQQYADYLASTRGLNKSDTPVSQQAMEQYGLGMGNLLSQKANAGLNMGLSATGLRLQGTGALPSGLSAAFNPQFQERLATPYQTWSGQGSSSSTSRYNPSLMDNIGQGMGLVSQGIGLGAQIGGMMMGIPPMGGFQGGLGSAQGMTMNPTMYNAPIGPVMG